MVFPLGSVRDDAEQRRDCCVMPIPNVGGLSVQYKAQSYRTCRAEEDQALWPEIRQRNPRLGTPPYIQIPVAGRSWYVDL
jgi:hypothetical protein